MAERSNLPAIREPSTIADVTRFAATPSLPSTTQMADLLAYGAVIAESGLFPNVASPQAAVMIMRFGQQLGIDEFTALSEIYWINRVPVCSAKLLNALIMRDHGGDAVVPVESTPQRCTISYKRRDWTERRQMTVTIEQYGHLRGRDNWKNYPADMLWARCVSRIARQAFADTIKGLQTREETSDAIDVEGRTVSVGDGRSEAMRRLHAIGAGRGLGHAALHAIAAGRGVESLAALSPTELVRLGDDLEDMTEDELRASVNPAPADEATDVDTGEITSAPEPTSEPTRQRVDADTGEISDVADDNTNTPEHDNISERTYKAVLNAMELARLANGEATTFLESEFGVSRVQDLSEQQAEVAKTLLTWTRNIDGKRREEPLLALADQIQQLGLGDNVWLEQRLRVRLAIIKDEAAK